MKLFGQYSKKIQNERKEEFYELELRKVGKFSAA